MTVEYSDTLQSRFNALVGVPIDSLLQQIDQQSPSGRNLKHNGVYSAIKAARSADDPSLPMGQWEHDLNMADWEEVSKLAIEAISEKSKDLQLAIWLLEAQLNQQGFSAIGPCIHFIHQLCATFWESMYPEVEDGDLEYRTNLIVWLNEKLQPVVKQLPITLARGEIAYSWEDWERAAQFEQLPAEAKKNIDPSDYLQTQTVVSAIIATPIEFYRDVFEDLQLAIIALDDFTQLLDDLCGHYSPSLGGLRNLLEEIYETLYSHVKHRGGLEAASHSDDVSEQDDELEYGAAGHQGGGHGGGPIRNRTDAYAQLAEAAEYISHDDPHSPVPHLIYKAIEWGQMNTAELYQELFIQYQGQLNIFEMMGLELDNKQQGRR